MVNPNSSARDDSEGNPTHGTNPARPGDESAPIHDSEADTAGEHTAGTDENPHPTTDEIFAQLVAGLSDVDSASASDDTDPSPVTPTNGAHPGGTVTRSDDGWDFPTAPWVQGSGPRDRVVTSDVAELEEAEDRFTQPDPGNVLSTDPVRNLAWAAVAGAPLVIIIALIFWPNASALVAQVSGVAFLVGLALLLWRMPKSRNHLDGDPGAVV